MRILADKLGRIYAITNDESHNTPQEYKETLNMFRGRQLKTNLKQCKHYLELSLKAQKGNEEASRELTEIHRNWNWSKKNL